MSPEMKKAPVLQHDGAEKRELSTDTSQGNPTHTPPSMSTASGSDLQNTVPHGGKQKIQNNFQSQLPPTHNGSTNTENATMTKKPVEATESASGPTNSALDEMKLADGRECHDSRGEIDSGKAVSYSGDAPCPRCHVRFEHVNEYQEKVRADTQHIEFLDRKHAMRELPEVDFFTILGA